MSFLLNIFRGRSDRNVTVPVVDPNQSYSSTGSKAEETEPQYPRQNPNQFVSLLSIRETDFVAIDKTQIPVPEADFQYIRDIGYTLGQKLGSGSFGDVFRSQFVDSANNCTELAVKLILIKETVSQDELIEQLNYMRTECLSLARAQHPHVITLQNCITSMRWNRSATAPQYPFYAYALICMELADSNLESYIQVIGAIPEEDGKEFLAQIVTSVGYLHSIGVAHRDVKPCNILLFRNPSFRAGFLLKICDFGIAHIFDVEEDPEPQTEELIGTLMYRAPETDESHRMNDQHSYDPRLADVYGIGIMYAQILIGHRRTKMVQLRCGRRLQKDRLIAELIGSNASNDAVDLIGKMIECTPEDRLDIRGILQHPYMPPPTHQEGWMQ